MQELQSADTTGTYNDNIFELSNDLANIFQDMFSRLNLILFVHLHVKLNRLESLNITIVYITIYLHKTDTMAIRPADTYSY